MSSPYLNCTLDMYQLPLKEGVQMQDNKNSENIYPPFKKQDISPPGLEKDLDPRPMFENTEYIGSDKLKDKIALITGGDSGIGRSIAVLFAREGAKVVAFTYLEAEEEDAKMTVDYIEAEGAQAIKIKTDFSNDNFSKQVIKEVIDQAGQIDVLINNAAYQNHLEDIDELNFSQFSHTFEVNIFSYFKMVKAALPHMKEGACIINTGSILGYVGDDNLIDYASTKGAIHTFTKSLAKNLSSRKIRVNSVAPGPVWTPLNPAERSFDEVKNFGKGTLFGRPAQPEEIAPAYVFLASDITASYITGETINLFGMVNGAN